MRFAMPFGTRQTRDLDRLIATQIAIGTSAFDLDAVMGTVAAEALALTRADAAVVELPEGDDVVYRAAAGRAMGFVGFRVPLETSISGLALRSREVLSCGDTRHDSRVNRAACERVGARSMLVVPLLHDGRAMGVLKVYAGKPNVFTSWHERILGGLAQLVGTALVRAELITRLEQQAVTDELTGLPNRRAWYARLDEAIARARRSNGPLTVIVLDLDGFKRVNDTEGHAAGDALLRATARSWAGVLREVDTLGRVGGDEFAVVAENADTTAAADIVARLAAAHPHRASAGFAIWDGAERSDALVGRADARMYADKRGHKAAA